MGIKRTVLIRLIDLKAVEYFSRNKILHKTQKTEIAILPLYFLGISFIIFNEFVGGVKRSQNQKIFFLLAHTYDRAQKSRRTENLDDFYNFHTALLTMSYILIDYSSLNHYILF